MTAAIGFSACQSPDDITGNQNVIPLGAAPVKSITVEIQTKDNSVINQLKSTAVQAGFNQNSNYVTVGTGSSEISLDVNANVPVPPSKEGIFVNTIRLFARDIIADGRTYTIKRGDNSQEIGAAFGTTTIYTKDGFSNTSNLYIAPDEENQFATIRFTTDEKNSRIVGDLTAYLAKDTTVRLPIDSAVTDEELNAIVATYQAMGFEIEFTTLPKRDGMDLIFAAKQVLINLQSKIIIQY